MEPFARDFLPCKVKNYYDKIYLAKNQMFDLGWGISYEKKNDNETEVPSLYLLSNFRFFGHVSFIFFSRLSI